MYSNGDKEFPIYFHFLTTTKQLDIITGIVDSITISETFDLEWGFQGHVYELSPNEFTNRDDYFGII